jgi:hypothetical protein
LRGHGDLEGVIRTVKEDLLWVRCLDTIEELRLALLELQHLCDQARIVEFGLGLAG